MGKTDIQWCHLSFNPWIGCTKVSAACDHCYAEIATPTRVKRAAGQETWGPHNPRLRTKNWNNPVKWNKALEGTGKRERVFCASLADVFDNHKSIDPAWRADLWQLIKATPNLDWLLLTKRPQNITRFLPDDWGMGYKNVWLGTTVENQTEADRRIPHLLTVPATVHFLSCEPLLGEIDLTSIEHNESEYRPLQKILWGELISDWFADTFEGEDAEESFLDWYQLAEAPNPDTIAQYKFDWIIVGGESGPHFRATDNAWFRALRDQCADAGVPFLFKQYGGKSQREIKALGRTLDGVVHDGYPEAVR